MNDDNWLAWLGAALLIAAILAIALIATSKTGCPIHQTVIVQITNQIPASPTPIIPPATCGCG